MTSPSNRRRRALSVWLVFALAGCVAENPVETDDAAPPAPDAGDMSIADDAGADASDAPDEGAMECRPKLSVSPGGLSFPRGPAFEEQTRAVTLENTGACSARLGVLLNGARSFRVRVGDTDLQRDQAPLADPDGDGTPGLAPGATVELTVAFTPTDDSPQAGEIEVMVEDGDPSTYRISLTGNTAGPCVRIEPAVLEFQAARGEQRTAEFVLESCGAAPATIQRITLGDDTADAFSLARVDALPVILAPAGAAGAATRSVVEVAFAPSVPGTVNGTVFIESDGLAETGRVQLVGRAQDNACPIAVAPDDVRAAVGDVIVLDGSASRDPDGPDGRPVEWRWSLVEAPSDARGQPVEQLFDADDPAMGGPQDDPTTPEALVWLDVPGRYVFELAVVDVQDASSADCDGNATLVVQVGGANRLQFQLTWTTPGDPRPDDANGADVDLEAEYAGVVCNAAEPTPDWAPAGPANNPVLDGDDRARGGPENIIVADPVGDGAYTLRAVYDDARGLGPSTATVRVFLAGALVAEESFDLRDNGDIGEFEYRLP